MPMPGADAALSFDGLGGRLMALEAAKASSSSWLQNVKPMSLMVSNSSTRSSGSDMMPLVIVR